MSHRLVTPGANWLGVTTAYIARWMRETTLARLVGTIVDDGDRLRGGVMTAALDGRAWS